jgi:hypothetical protein
MSFHDCPRCGRYNCFCSRYDLEEHHRRNRFDMNFDAEQDLKRKIRRMEDDERSEEIRREEEEEQERYRIQAERQRQEREEEEAYWEARREEEEAEAQHEREG